MTLEQFKASLEDDVPPASVGELLQALWHEANDDWDKSHTIVQDIDSQEASWIHAYLHRKEGDLGNAAYWYQRAGRSMPSSSVNDEWEEIVKHFL